MGDRRKPQNSHKVVLEAVPGEVTMLAALVVLLAMAHIDLLMHHNNRPFHPDSGKAPLDMPYLEAQKLHACHW